MRWSKALLATVSPSLIVGPLLGIVGGASIALLLNISSGALGAFVFAVIFGSLFGLVLGLMIATPICLIAGSVMLLIAARYQRWTFRPIWAVVGAGVGLGTGIAICSFGNDLDFYIAVLTIFPALGALGGWLCHGRLQRTIAELHTVDVDIFT